MNGWEMKLGRSGWGWYQDREEAWAMMNCGWMSDDRLAALFGEHSSYTNRFGLSLPVMSNLTLVIVVKTELEAMLSPLGWQTWIPSLILGTLKYLWHFNIVLQITTENGAKCRIRVYCLPHSHVLYLLYMIKVTYTHHILYMLQLTLTY